MTPERLAEIKRGYHVGCVTELLAEIDRLTREIGVERAQAFQDFAGMKKLYTTEIDRLNKVVDQAIECARSWHVIYSATRHPELAAELQRRGK